MDLLRCFYNFPRFWSRCWLVHSACTCKCFCLTARGKALELSTLVAGDLSLTFLPCLIDPRSMAGFHSVPAKTCVAALYCCS